MCAPAVPGCCILDRARTAAGFHRAAAWSEPDRVVPYADHCGGGNQLLCVLCAFAVIISVCSVPSVATPVVYNSAPQSVNFFANYEEFRTRHTALLTDGYRRQARRLCDVWLRLRRAGDNFVPWIPLNDAFAVTISVYSVISVATPVVYDSARSVERDSEPVPAHRESLRMATDSSGGFLVCLWCVGSDRPGAPGSNDHQPIMSDRCSVVFCVPGRQAGPAREDSCSKFQMLNAKCSVLNALHRRYPCRSFTPCAPGRGVKC